MKRLMTHTVALLCLLGCERLSAGEPCEAEGDGFTRTDPCAETCVEWAVTCPDGTASVPDVCSDGPCSTDADCDAGFLCLDINATDAECLPESVCP